MGRIFWRYRRFAGMVLFCLAAVPGPVRSLQAQPVDAGAQTRWITVTEMAAGTDPSAKDEAVSRALRKSVEQACGVFLTSQSQSANYTGIYDKVFADAVGYVKSHRVIKTWTAEGITFAKVKAEVSTQKFRQDWAAIAHTYHQENAPRVLIAIGQTTYEMVNELEETQTSTSTETDTVDLRATQSVDVLQQDRSAAAGATVSQQGTFNRRGQPRPRNWQTTRGGQTSAADRRLRGQSEVGLSGQAVSTTQSADSQKSWRRVANELENGGSVQNRLERFFLDKGIRLVDRNTAGSVSKRDLMLATADDDVAAVLAIGARYQADVLLTGTAGAQYLQEVRLAGRPMYQYQAKLVVRAVRTDTGQLLTARSFGPITVTTMQKTGGTDKALAKLADDVAPDVLSDLIEAWRRQVNVTRNINLQIGGLTFGDWKTLKTQMEDRRGVKAVRLREMTQSVASIDVDSELSTEQIAEHLSELPAPVLQVVELTPNRIKLKVVK